MPTAFISNNIRLRGLNTRERAAVTATLSVDNPIYLDRVAKKRPTWGIDKKLRIYIQVGTDIIVPRGVYLDELTQLIAPSNLKAVWDTTIVPPIDFGVWNPEFPLKDDQRPAIAACLNGNGILVAPAGSGKTIMGMRYIWQRQQPALWITHTKDLMYQSKQRAETLLGGVGEVGVLGDGIIRWGDGKLIVATVQTLQNPKWIDVLNPLIGTIVVDEAHHFPALSFIETVGQFKATYMLGLTATPDRKDKLEVYMYRGIGPKLYQIDRTGLYDSGRLVKPGVRFVYTDFEYEQASIRSGSGAVDAGGEELDYRDLLNHLIADQERIRLIAHQIMQHRAQYQIVITESVRYCYRLRDWLKITDPRLQVAVVHGPLQRYAWRAAGTKQRAESLVKCGEAIECRYSDRLRRWEAKYEQYSADEYADWNITGPERKRRLKLCEEKQIDVLIATQLAREGLDLPHLSVGHMAMPKRGDSVGSKNGASVEQEIGRIMRPDPKNPSKEAIWYDYVDDRVGVLKNQYYSRRSVYKRLQLNVSPKPKMAVEEFDKYLMNFD